MGIAEGKIENYLKQQAVKYGFLCYKFTSPGTNGVPDRILIGHNTVIFVECKSETGRLSKIQKYTIKQMQNHTANVITIASKAEIDTLLQPFKDKR